MGGFEYMGLINIFSCDKVRAVSSLLDVTKLNAPIRSPKEIKEKLYF